MTKQLVHTGISLVSYGYKAGRDLRWFVAWRLQRP